MNIVYASPDYYVVDWDPDGFEVVDKWHTRQVFLGGENGMAFLAVLKQAPDSEAIDSFLSDLLPIMQQHTDMH